MKHPPIGILNVLKTPGITSHGVVSRLRKLLAMRQIGHGGTLDPGATGVLPVLVGRATKLMSYVVEHPKTYRAEMTLGQSTDTQDASGTPLTNVDDFEIQLRQFEHVTHQFIGQLEQIPPMTSAVRHDGKRLYERARQGESVDRPARSIFVERIDILDVTSPNGEDKLVSGSRVFLEIECSKGTYIRTICHDIGQALGCGAYMSFLVRTQVGPFHLRTSHTLDEIKQAVDNGDLHTVLMPPGAGLLHLPRIDVGTEEINRLRQGQSVALKLYNADEGHEGNGVAVMGPDDRLVCIGRMTVSGQDVILQPTRVF